MGEYGAEASLHRYAQEREQFGIRERASRPTEKATGHCTAVELAANDVDYAKQYYSKARRRLPLHQYLIDGLEHRLDLAQAVGDGAGRQRQCVQRNAWIARSSEW